MTKYYRVKKTNFLWEEGAILKYSESLSSVGGYQPISDIWNVVEEDKNITEYVSPVFVENNPEWFERVYQVDMVTKTVYEVKEKAKSLMANGFKKTK